MVFSCYNTINATAKRKSPRHAQIPLSEPQTNYDVMMFHSLKRQKGSMHDMMITHLCFFLAWLLVSLSLRWFERVREGLFLGKVQATRSGRGGEERLVAS